MAEETGSILVGNDMSRTANYSKIAPVFAERFGRLPLSPYDPAASINDLIFMRSIEPQWSALERTLVDKSTAKAQVAILCPSLRIPHTLATIAMDTVRSPAELFDLLAPFVGTDAIAKPAQASGGVLFLRAVTTPHDVAELYGLATRDYSMVMREMQYAGLPRRIIVETLVPTISGTPPDDFKVHCIRGEPLLCQVDHARFGSRWSRVLRLPDFEPLDRTDGLTPPASLVMPATDRVAAMIATARALAASFVYARIDLYNGVDGVYFGEVTFTPAGSLGIAPSAAGCHRETETHRIYSRTLMDAFRRDHRDAA